MKIYRKPSGSWSGSQWLLVILASVMGCGPSGQPQAQGRVQLADGIAFTFEGDTLELRAKSKPSQIAFGQIHADGSFQVESLVDGTLVQGAPAGSYQARLVIADDDYKHKAHGQQAIPRKYFNFATSTLNVEVPSNNNQLTISK